MCWNSGWHSLSPGPSAAASLPAAALPTPLHNLPPCWVHQPPSALPPILSTRLPVSAPPTGLDTGFFFISLVVRLPYSSIFCQFWLFFVFELLFFWLCEEAQCVYLCLHLGQRKSLFFFLKISEKGREGESEREKHLCMRDIALVSSCSAPSWGPGPQPRHMP